MSLKSLALFLSFGLFPVGCASGGNEVSSETNTNNTAATGQQYSIRG